MLVLATLGWRQVRRYEAAALLLAETGQAVIRTLGLTAEALSTADPEALGQVYARDFVAGERSIWALAEPLVEDGVEVSEWRPSAGAAGAAGGEWPDRMLAALPPLVEVELSKLKLALLERYDSASATAKAVLWMRGVGPDGERVESQARLRLGLRRRGELFVITSQELIEGRTVRGRGVGFTDVAAEAGLDFRARRNPLFSTPEWTPHTFGIVRYAHAGVSTGDYDGDGWYDVFFANGEHPALYRNLGGRFVETTAAAGIDPDLIGVATALFVDLDDDGDRDLFLGRITGDNLLYRNDGDGSFTDVSAEAGLGGRFVTGAAAADYDRDGDLDLYVTRYLDPRKDLPTTLFYTRNSQGNSLLRNDGGLRFTDVTESAGVREGGLSLGSSFADVDADGDLDLYVANDFGRNALLRNEGDGTFTDVSHHSDAWDLGYGMSTSFGDVDADGDLDLYVSNVHSGQRWYGQAATLYGYLLNSVRQGTIFEDLPLYRELYSYLGADWKEAGDEVISGNSLLLNDGGGSFREVGEIAGADPFGWYWGSTMLDYDNDGDLDIYAANGWISGRVYDDL